jgi:hypothetical protein
MQVAFFDIPAQPAPASFSAGQPVRWQVMYFVDPHRRGLANRRRDVLELDRLMATASRQIPVPPPPSLVRAGRLFPNRPKTPELRRLSRSGSTAQARSPDVSASRSRNTTGRRGHDLGGAARSRDVGCKSLEGQRHGQILPAQPETVPRTRAGRRCSRGVSVGRYTFFLIARLKIAMGNALSVARQIAAQEPFERRGQLGQAARDDGRPARARESGGP